MAERTLTSFSQVIVGDDDVVAIVIVDTDVFAMGGLDCWLAAYASMTSEKQTTHIGNNFDVHITGLLGGIGRWPVVGEGIGIYRSLATPRFVCDLLASCPLPLLAGLCSIVLVLAI